MTRHGAAAASSRLRSWGLYAAVLAAGCASALGLAPSFLWPVTLAGLAFLFWALVRQASARRAAWVSWLFAFGYFLIGLRWLMEPFQVEADIYAWMAPFALVLMAGGLALFWALAGWACAYFAPSEPGGRPLLIAVAFGGVEFLRGTIFTGFPWAQVAQIWVETPVIQIIGWISVVWLDVATFAVAALVAGVALPLWTRAVSVIVIAAGVLLPSLLPDDRRGTDQPIVRVVQPNAPQHEKWDPDKAPIFFRRMIEATAAGDVPDLIVWPETAIPVLLHNADEWLEIVSDAARGAPVMLGVQRAEQGAFYNSLILLENGVVTDTYDKRHLVPFGEYMPFGAVFSRLGIAALADRVGSGYTAGTRRGGIDITGMETTIPLICYEAIFPGYARSDGVPPRYLTQITNDAWFGTYAGPQQHLAQARMRAIEQGVPLVRSANTGISAVIGPNGEIVDSLALGTHGYIDVPLPLVSARAGSGIRHYISILPPVLVLLALALLLWRRSPKVND